MSRTVKDEEANWTKAVSGLNITKCGLILSISEILKSFLSSFSPEQRGHLSEFFKNIHDKKNLKYEKRKRKERGSWKIDPGCCESDLCQTILDLLWEKHVNKSKHVVWSPTIEASKLYKKNTTRKTKGYTEVFDETCYLCGEENCPYERNRKGVPLFDDKPKRDVDKYYWQLANMYMFRGRESICFPNTGPDDTDVSLIFKLMKNCKLFLLDEDDTDNTIYDDLLEVRNLLMHSFDNRLSDEAMEECFDRMKSVLKANMFYNEHSKKAMTELEKLNEMRIVMTSVTPEQVNIIQAAFDSQQSSLQFDIHVKSSLKNNIVLEGILTASTYKKEKYENDARQPPAPPYQPPAPSYQDSSPERQSPEPPRRNPRTQRQNPVRPRRNNPGERAGTVVGAVAGAVGGTPGMIVGGTIGGLIGKLFD